MTSSRGGAPWSTASAVPRSHQRRVVVVGMGSDWRHDDGVGPAVAGRAAARLDEGAAAHCEVVAPLADPLDLLGHWDGADLAVIVDATSSGAVAGTIWLIELEDHQGGEHLPSSTHGIGVAGVLALARAVGRAPVRTVVVGIEGEDFTQGSGLTPSVAAAVDEATAVVVELVKEALTCV